MQYTAGFSWKTCPTNFLTSYCSFVTISKYLVRQRSPNQFLAQCKCRKNHASVFYLCYFKTIKRVRWEYKQWSLTYTLNLLKGFCLSSSPFRCSHFDLEKRCRVGLWHGNAWKCIRLHTHIHKGWIHKRCTFAQRLQQSWSSDLGNEKKNVIITT